MKYESVEIYDCHICRDSMKFKTANILLLVPRWSILIQIGCWAVILHLGPVMLSYESKEGSNPIISAEPVFIVRPSSQRIGLNGIAKFDCVAQGNPPPSVFWAKEVDILLYIIMTMVLLSLPGMVQEYWIWWPSGDDATYHSTEVWECHTQQIPILLHCSLHSYKSYNQPQFSPN